MAHKTLIGGTAYNVVSGTSMVSGTTYNISGGKTVINGTGYNIDIGPTGPVTAMLYSDGSFVFQSGDEVAAGKTLTASYTDFVNTTGIRWNGKQNTFTSVSFDTKVQPIGMARWFNNSKNMIANISNFRNLKMDKITSMNDTYRNCTKITGFPVCGPNVTNMSFTYYNCTNLTGSPVCGNNVTAMPGAYYNCINLTGSPVCGNKIYNISNTYYNCTNLTGSPVCGPNVTNMSFTYYNCTKLTGSPVCGNKVTNMARTYTSTNLTGSPVCGPNVTNMCYAYGFCTNLTGSPVCGPNVTNMSGAYIDCKKLTGSPVCGNKVTSMYGAYRNCINLSGNAYFYSSSINDAQNCFYGKNNSKRLNIYVVANSTTNTTVHYNNTYSLVGQNITWTNAGSYQYNTTYNIYIYPVSNVAANRAKNGD